MTSLTLSTVQISPEEVSITSKTNNDFVETINIEHNIHKVNINSRSIRLAIFGVLYYIWILTSLSIAANALKQSNPQPHGDWKTGNELYIASSVFILIAIICLAIQIIFYGIRKNYHQTLKTFSKKNIFIFQSGIYFIIGGVLRIIGTAYLANYTCIDILVNDTMFTDNNSYCKSSYFATDFLAEFLSIVFGLDVIFVSGVFLGKLLNRLMWFSILIAINSMMFAIDYGYYSDTCSSTTDNKSYNYVANLCHVSLVARWMLTVITFAIALFSALIMANFASVRVLDKLKRIEFQWIYLLISITILTCSSLSWIFTTLPVGYNDQLNGGSTENTHYGKQFAMFYLFLCACIAYDVYQFPVSV